MEPLNQTLNIHRVKKLLDDHVDSGSESSSEEEPWSPSLPSGSQQVVPLSRQWSPNVGSNRDSGYVGSPAWLNNTTFVFEALHIQQQFDTSSPSDTFEVTDGSNAVDAIPDEHLTSHAEHSRRSSCPEMASMISHRLRLPSTSRRNGTIAYIHAETQTPSSWMLTSSSYHNQIPDNPRPRLFDDESSDEPDHPISSLPDVVLPSCDDSTVHRHQERSRRFGQILLTISDEFDRRLAVSRQISEGAGIMDSVRSSFRWIGGRIRSFSTSN
ncbi:Uncharacterised protein at_DN1643 [Pycnogonum litorale]